MEQKTLYREKTRFNNRHFEIKHTDDPKAPWMVSYCGTDFQFKNLYGCLCYAVGRRFIDQDEIDRVMREINNQMSKRCMMEGSKGNAQS